MNTIEKKSLKNIASFFIVRFVVDVFCGTLALMFVIRILMIRQGSLVDLLRWFFNNFEHFLEMLNIVGKRDLFVYLVANVAALCILGVLFAEFVRLFLYLWPKVQLWFLGVVVQLRQDKPVEKEEDDVKSNH